MSWRRAWGAGRTAARLVIVVDVEFFFFLLFFFGGGVSMVLLDLRGGVGVWGDDLGRSGLLYDEVIRG